MAGRGSLLVFKACDSSQLTIFDRTSGELTEIPVPLRRAQLAPDKTKLAALVKWTGRGGFEHLASQRFPTLLIPDQIAWDVTGTSFSTAVDGTRAAGME